MAKIEKQVYHHIPEGYEQYWFCGEAKGRAGTALLTKVKPIEVTYGIGVPKHDAMGRVIIAEYEKFYLVGVYVPYAGHWFANLDYRVQEWDIDFQNKL